MSLKIFNGTGSKLDFYAESQCYTIPDDETSARYILFNGQKPVLSLPSHKTLEIHRYRGNTPRIADKAQIKIVSEKTIYGIEKLPPDYDIYAVTTEYALAYRIINGFFPIKSPLATPETLVYSESGDVMGYLALAIHA